MHESMLSRIRMSFLKKKKKKKKKKTSLLKSQNQ
jgi:hypothetical protein